MLFRWIRVTIRTFTREGDSESPPNRHLHLIRNFLVKISHSANAYLLVLLAAMISESLSLLPNKGAHSLLLRTTASLSDLSITKYSIQKAL